MLEGIKAFFLNAVLQIRRVLPDFVIFILIIVALLIGLYKYLPAPLQAVMMKALLVSCGFLHAHITRKIAFPAVEWGPQSIKDDDGVLKLLIIVLYAVIIYAYASGG